MQKTRMVLAFMASAYLLTTIMVSGQYLDRKVAIIEERLKSHIQDVSEPALSRLSALEDQVRDSNLAIESRLSKVEETQGAIKQLVMAVGIGVLVHLISNGLGALRTIRQNRGDKRER